MGQTRRSALTPEELTELVTMWNSNTPAPEIASALNLKQRTLSQIVVNLRKEGVPLVSRRGGHNASVYKRPELIARLKVLAADVAAGKHTAVEE